MVIVPNTHHLFNTHQLCNRIPFPPHHHWLWNLPSFSPKCPASSHSGGATPTTAAVLKLWACQQASSLLSAPHLAPIHTGCLPLLLCHSAVSVCQDLWAWEKHCWKFWQFPRKCQACSHLLHSQFIPGLIALLFHYHRATLRTGTKGLGWQACRHTHRFVFGKSVGTCQHSIKWKYLGQWCLESIEKVDCTWIKPNIKMWILRQLN